MTGKYIILTVGITLLVIIVGALLLSFGTRHDQEGGEPHYEANITPDQQHNKTAAIPEDLKLPFNISDINESRGDINPIGVVRFSKDEGHTGHSGIDVSLRQGSPIYAVAPGKIITVKSASDPWGGQGVFHLLRTTRPGEGWAYLYEHVTPASNIQEGVNVETGDLIGHKTAPEGFTAHFQYSYIFNNHQFTRDVQCWVDFLAKADQSIFLNWWQGHINSGVLAKNWRTNEEEGQYPFRGLLNPSLYPDGPQLCYPLGTDVR